MKAISKRQPPADTELVLEHQGRVRAYLVYLGTSQRLLDDLVQDTFVAALSSPFEERNPKATAAWLRTIARHLFLKALERERRLPVIDDLDEAERVWSDYDRDDGGERYLEALRTCLAGVDGKATRVLELRYRERQRRAAIAGELGMSENGVKSILVRTKKRLRDCVEAKLARA